MSWTDVLNHLLCSKRIDGYALLDPSSGNVVLGFGVLYEGFMVPDDRGQMSSVEERRSLTDSLQLEHTPKTLTVKGKNMVVVRRDASFVFAVGYRRQYSISVHSLYAGILVVAYSSPVPQSLQVVLDGILCHLPCSSRV